MKTASRQRLLQQLKTAGQQPAAQPCRQFADEGRARRETEVGEQRQAVDVLPEGGEHLAIAGADLLDASLLRTA